MKQLDLETRELETLVWALTNQAHRIMRYNSEHGKPMKDDRVERIDNILKKAGRLMREAHKEGTET